MFTIVERTEAQFGRWFVLDDHGEERGRYYLFNAALLFATKLTSEEQDYERDLARRRQDALQAEAHNFVAAAHREGQSRAYSHAAMRLSFLLGGTLPAEAKLAEARKLVASLDEWAHENKAKALEINAKIEERVSSVR